MLYKISKKKKKKTTPVVSVIEVPIKKLSKRERVVMRRWVTKGGSLNAAMRGEFSEATIQSGKVHKHIKESKEWNDYMEKYLSDEVLAEKHKELLDKKEVLVRNNTDTGESEIIRTGEIDVQAVKAALDMAYKLKKKYGDITITHKLGQLSDAEVEDGIAGEVSEVIGAIARTTQKKGK